MLMSLHGWWPFFFDFNVKNLGLKNLSPFRNECNHYSSGTPSKPKPHTKKTQKQTNKQKVDSFLIANRFCLWKLPSISTKGTFLKPHHVLRLFPFHSTFHLCTYSKSSHQCNIIPLYQNWNQQDLEKEGKMSDLEINRSVVRGTGERNGKCYLARNIVMCLGDDEEQHLCSPELKRNRSAKQ